MKPGEDILTIFTVDDSEIVYKSMASLLSENQQVNWVGHAYSLSDAYRQIDAKIPAFIILDIQFREGSSFELLAYITRQYPETQVMMFTNLSSAPYRKKCLELGASWFLDKSDEFEEIPKIIAEVLERKALRGSC